jgi:HNH endonuclease/AP2 domain
MNKQITLDNGMRVLVNKVDYKRLIKHEWKAIPSGHNFYAYRNTKLGQLFLHTDVAKAAGIFKKGFETDHKNGVSLDCRRSNLRNCTRSNNLANRSKFTSYNGKPCTSQFKGVTLNQKSGRWIGQLRHDKQLIYLGSFDAQEEAALAYNRAARLYHGKFARLNDQPIIKKLEKAFNKLDKSIGKSYYNELVNQLN